MLPKIQLMSHPKKAAAFIQDEKNVREHDRAVWFLRSRRDRAVFAIHEWEQLRERAAQIKTHTMSHLDDYLEQFEHNAVKKGVEVHWARDAQEHNRIVHRILDEHEATRVVKSKSNLTGE